VDDSFVDLLKSLTDDAEPVDRVGLGAISDLDADRLASFTRVWEQLPPGRRNSLLQELGLIADAQIELSFEAINRFALDDPESSIRQQAIENLWECEDPGLARGFVHILNDDSSDEVRGAAGKALGVFILIGETRVLNPEIQQAVEESLLLAARGDSSGKVRDFSLQSLGYSSRSEVPDLIEHSYASQSESGIVAALRAMARSANQVWGENVMARLNDGSPQIRLAAVRAAGDINLREGVSDLIELLEDVDEKVRRAAMWSLSQIGGTRASRTLKSLTEAALEEGEQETLLDAIDNLVFVEGARDLFSVDFDDPQDPKA
jgi:hypothetical protein